MGAITRHNLKGNLSSSGIPEECCKTAKEICEERWLEEDTYGEKLSHMESKTLSEAGELNILEITSSFQPRPELLLDKNIHFYIETTDTISLSYLVVDEDAHGFKELRRIDLESGINDITDLVKHNYAVITGENPDNISELSLYYLIERPELITSVEKDFDLNKINEFFMAELLNGDETSICEKIDKIKNKKCYSEKPFSIVSPLVLDKESIPDILKYSPNVPENIQFLVFNTYNGSIIPEEFKDKDDIKYSIKTDKRYLKEFQITLEKGGTLYDLNTYKDNNISIIAGENNPIPSDFVRFFNVTKEEDVKNYPYSNFAVVGIVPESPFNIDNHGKILGGIDGKFSLERTPCEAIEYLQFNKVSYKEFNRSVEILTAKTQKENNHLSFTMQDNTEVLSINETPSAITGNFTEKFNKGDGLTLPNTNEIKINVTDTETKLYTFFATFNIQASGVANTIKFQLYKNGVAVGTPIERYLSSGGDMGAASVSDDVEAVNGDIIELRVSTKSGNANCTIKNMSVIFKES